MFQNIILTFHKIIIIIIIIVTLIYTYKTYIKKNLERNRNPQNFKITIFYLERNSLLYMLMTTYDAAVILLSHNYLPYIYIYIYFGESNYLPFCLTQLNKFLTFTSTYFVLTNDLLTLSLISIRQYPMSILKFISRIVLVFYDSTFLKHEKPTSCF